MNLVRTIISEIGESNPVSFQSRSSIETSVQRLRQNIKRSFLFSLFSEAPIGKVTGENVVIYRYRPFLHNPGRPVFRGRFVVQEGQTHLIGTFSLHPFVRGFLYLWFGFLGVAVFWTLVVGVSIWIEEGHGILWGFAIVLLSFVFGLMAAGVMAGLGYYFVRFQ